MCVFSVQMFVSAYVWLLSVFAFLVQVFDIGLSVYLSLIVFVAVISFS